MVTCEVSTKVAVVKHFSGRMMNIVLKFGSKYIDVIQVYAVQHNKVCQKVSRMLSVRCCRICVDNISHHEISMDTLEKTDLAVNQSVAGAFGIAVINKEGQRISNFCLQSQLAVIYAFYNHNEQQKWTWCRWSNETQDYKVQFEIDLLANENRLTGV